MDVRELDRRWGATASKWVWSARPRYVFEEDGSEREDLEPVDEVLPEDYSDESAWWTCDPKTEMHNIAVIYRNAGTNDPDFPVGGPKDLCYVCLVLSNPFPLADNPLAGEFAEHYGCRYIVLARFQPPIGIGELRTDPVTRDWGALRAGFVKAAMPMPDQIWHRLVEMAEAHRPPRRGSGRRRRRLPEGERHRLEQRLEDWLEVHPEELAKVALNVAVERRQVLCSPGHDGTIDLLCRHTDQPGSYLVVELKSEEIKRDAIAQVLGYVAWLRSRTGIGDVTALVIGLDPHIQVPWVLKTLPQGLVELAHWGQFNVPVDLARELGLRR